MEGSLVLVAGAFVLVAVAMAGLAVGVLLRKRTPLRGSCRGAACEREGEKAMHEGCLCAREADRAGPPE